MPPPELQCALPRQPHPHLQPRKALRWHNTGQRLQRGGHTRCTTVPPLPPVATTHGCRAAAEHDLAAGCTPKAASPAGDDSITECLLAYHPTASDQVSTQAQLQSGWGRPRRGAGGEAATTTSWLQRQSGCSCSALPPSHRAQQAQCGSSAPSALPRGGGSACSPSWGRAPSSCSLLSWGLPLGSLPLAYTTCAGSSRLSQSCGRLGRQMQPPRSHTTVSQFAALAGTTRQMELCMRLGAPELSSSPGNELSAAHAHPSLC